MAIPEQHGLGRREPPDWKHVEKYPVRRLVAFAETVSVVNKSLDLGPATWRTFYDQGQEGACCGFSASWMMSIRNRRRYAARWLYLEAQNVDEWGDTPPEEGTSIRATCDVLRDKGHRRVRASKEYDVALSDGIEANRWATTVDEVRTAIANDNPVVFGINWYSKFSEPQWDASSRRWWIGKGDLGSIRGGHGICCFAARDRYQAVGLVNTWGLSYPLVWVPYNTIQRLIDENGEAALITDR
jgi:hypothetical protein